MNLSANRNDEGLGLSLIIFAAAIAAGLAVIVVPIVWANGPTVYDNPAVKTSALPGGPAYVDKTAAYPLAVLHNQPIVNAAMLAELNAKAPAATATRRVRAAQHNYAQARDNARRSYAQAQQQDDDATIQRPARHGLFFGLF